MRDVREKLMAAGRVRSTNQYENRFQRSPARFLPIVRIRRSSDHRNTVRRRLVAELLEVPGHSFVVRQQLRIEVARDDLAL